MTLRKYLAEDRLSCANIEAAIHEQSAKIG